MGVKGAAYCCVVVLAWWMPTFFSPWYMDFFQLCGVDSASCGVDNYSNIEVAQEHDPLQQYECWLSGDCVLQTTTETTTDGSNRQVNGADVNIYESLYGSRSRIPSEFESSYNGTLAIYIIAWFFYVCYFVGCSWIAWRRYHGSPTYAMNAIPLQPKPQDAKSKRLTLSFMWVIWGCGMFSWVLVVVAVHVFGFGYENNARSAGLGIDEFTGIDLEFNRPVVMGGSTVILNGVRTYTAHIGWVMALVMLIPHAASMIALPAGG